MAHGLQCLRDRRACCPVLPKQLVICRFLRFQRRRHVVVSSRCSCVLVRVVLNFSLNGNRANVYAHVVVTRERVCRTVFSVCATGARVAQSFPSNFEVSAAPSRWCFNSLFHWTGKLYKHPCARGGGARASACLLHACPTGRLIGCWLRRKFKNILTEVICGTTPSYLYNYNYNLHVLTIFNSQQ